VTEYAAGAITYFLTCNSGSAQSSANAAITWTLAAPTATLQVATGSNGFLNNPIQLTWSSTVSPCVESGGNTNDGWTGTVAANGTQTVNETTAGSYTYIITCGSGSRSATAQFRVTFVAPVVTLQDGGITSANIGQPITLTGSGAGTNCANSGGSSGDGWPNYNLIANGGTPHPHREHARNLYLYAELLGRNHHGISERNGLLLQWSTHGDHDDDTRYADRPKLDCAHFMGGQRRTVYRQRQRLFEPCTEQLRLRRRFRRFGERHRSLHVYGDVWNRDQYREREQHGELGRYAAADSDRGILSHRYRDPGRNLLVKQCLAVHCERWPTR